MKPDALSHLLTTFYKERLGLLLRHQAGARLVSAYNVNNTYQYLIAREEVQLGWVRAALETLGGTAPAGADAIPVPAASPDSRAILEDDARLMREFVARWRPQLAQVTDARNRKMLELILGETLEHLRFFDQAVAGQDDLLGRRTTTSPAVGKVLADRWVE